jgi:FMN phosphatase YigB (HAD superfamily)
MEVRYVVFDLGSTLLQTPSPQTRKARRLSYFQTIFQRLRAQGIDSLIAGLESMHEEQFAQGLTAHIDRLKGHVEDWTLRDSILHYLHEHLNHGKAEKSDIIDICHASELVEDVTRDESLIDVAGYEPWPDTLSTLQTLKAQGLRIAVYINTCSYAKAQKILRETGVGKELDYVFVSGETQVQAPSREVNTVVLNTLGIAESEVIYVGDMLDRLVKSAQISNLKAIWLNLSPSYPVFPM